MRVYAMKALRDFWSRPGLEDAEGPLRAWYKRTEAAAWSHFAALRNDFPSVDLVGRCSVFDILNNNYRLIAHVNFQYAAVYVLGVLTHAEYDENTWPESCRCHEKQKRRKRRA